MPTYNFRNLRPGLRPEAALIVLREREAQLARERDRSQETDRLIAKMEFDGMRAQRLWDQLQADIKQAEASGKSAAEIAAEVKKLRESHKETCRRTFS